MNVREVLNAIFLCALDRLSVEGPAQDFPPRSTVWEYLDLWEWDGDAGADPPRALCGSPGEGRPRSEPDDGDHRQSDREGSRQRGASLDPSGYDAGKKVVGRKRHILDRYARPPTGRSTFIRPVLQDRDGAEGLLREARRTFPS